MLKKLIQSELLAPMEESEVLGCWVTYTEAELPEWRVRRCQEERLFTDKVYNGDRRVIL